MHDNYYRVLELIEQSTDGMDIDSVEFNELTKEISSFDKRELVRYCQAKLKEIRRQLLFRDFKYFMLGVLLALIIYLALCFLFPEYFPNDLLGVSLILPCVYLVFELRPKNHPLAKQVSKYMNFKSKFSSKKS